MPSGWGGLGRVCERLCTIVVVNNCPFNQELLRTTMPSGWGCVDSRCGGSVQLLLWITVPLTRKLLRSTMPSGWGGVGCGCMWTPLIQLFLWITVPLTRKLLRTTMPSGWGGFGCGCGGLCTTVSVNNCPFNQEITTDPNAKWMGRCWLWLWGPRYDCSCE